MAETPNWDITYPEAGDHTRLWEHFEELAWNVETAMNQAMDGGHVRIQTGFTTAGPSNASSFTKALAFAFPFALPPVVMVNCASGAGATAQWHQRAIGISTDGFQVFGFGPSITTFSAVYQYVAIGAI